jgi:hypothetical protein
MWACFALPKAHLRFGSARLAPSPAPIRLSPPVLPSGNPERQDAPCAPRSYGDGCDACGVVGGLAVGGGVRRGFSVGAGVGSGVGVGSAVALGVGSTEGSGVGVGVGSGVAEGDGSIDTDGSAVLDGAGVVVDSGDCETAGLGVVAIVEGSAVWAAGTEVVGVATGSMVARGKLAVITGTTNCDAANTNAPPSSATDRMVTTRVPVVRIAPRTTCVRRSATQDRLAWRRARSSSAATRIRSSRSGVDRGTASEPSRLRTRVLLPISAEHAGQPRTCAASRAASRGSSSSSRNASMRSLAREQSRACDVVTLYT